MTRRLPRLLLASLTLNAALGAGSLTAPTVTVACSEVLAQEVVVPGSISPLAVFAVLASVVIALFGGVAVFVRRRSGAV
jgi:hypothetical protein